MKSAAVRRARRREGRVAGEPVSRARATRSGAAFRTTSGLVVERLYTPEDVRSTTTRDLGYPGELPVHARHPPDHVPGPALDHAPVRGLRHRRGDQRALPLPPGAGPDGALGRLRPPHADGLRLRRTPWPRARWGGWASPSTPWRTCAPSSRASRWTQVSTSMTINATAAILLALYVAVGDEQGVPREQLSGTVQNDILKEYIARGTYIYPVEPQPAPRHRHLRVLRRRGAALEHDLHLRLPHPGGGLHRGAGGRLHLRQRPRVRASAPCAAGLDFEDFAPRLSFFFAAHNDLLEEVAKFRAARRLWARLMRERFGASDESAPPALPHPDGRLHPHRPAAAEQRRPGHRAGARRRAGRHPVAAHQRLRRGAGAAHRGVRHARAAHPADPGPRVGRRRAPSTRSAAPTTWRRSPTRSRRGPGRYLEHIDEMGGRRPGHRLHAGGDPPAAYRHQLDVESGARGGGGEPLHGGRGARCAIGAARLHAPWSRPAPPSLAALQGRARRRRGPRRTSPGSREAARGRRQPRCRPSSTR